MSHLQKCVFRKTCETKLAMPISVQGERVEEEQNAILAPLEARSREELARALLGIALQRSRASAGAVLFNENGQFVPFATSNWAENAVRGVRFAMSASSVIVVGNAIRLGFGQQAKPLLNKPLRDQSRPSGATVTEAAE